MTKKHALSHSGLRKFSYEVFGRLPVILLALMPLAFSGCGSDNANGIASPDASQKTILTLATYDSYLDNKYLDAIGEFNQSNQDYFIEIIEYDEIEPFTINLTAGNVPDMVYITFALPYADYARNGLLEDLYPYIDADPELSRDDFVQPALNAAQMDGGLYGIFSDFYLFTFFGLPTVLGTDYGWSIDEFEAILNEHDLIDAPFGAMDTREFFLMNTINADIDNYINKETGTVSFDSQEFIRLLNISNRFPASRKAISINNNASQRAAIIVDTTPEEEKAIIAGKQLAKYDSLGDMGGFLHAKVLLGGEIAIKGWPSDTNNHHEIRVAEDCLAILATSQHKDAAWSFLRTFLDKDWQLENTDHSFPSNQEAFDQKAAYEMEFFYVINGYSRDRFTEDPSEEEEVQGEIAQLTQDDINAVTALINSATARQSLDVKLLNIIREEIALFIDGTRGAEETAKVLQSRVSLYVAERQ